MKMKTKEKTLNIKCCLCSSLIQIISHQIPDVQQIISKSPSIRHNKMPLISLGNSSLKSFSHSNNSLASEGDFSSILKD